MSSSVDSHNQQPLPLLSSQSQMYFAFTTRGSSNHSYYVSKIVATVGGNAVVHDYRLTMRTIGCSRSQLTLDIFYNNN